MNQEAFDVVLKTFHADVKSGKHDRQGLVNALRHKIESVDFGVNTDAALKAIADLKLAPVEAQEPVIHVTAGVDAEDTGPIIKSDGTIEPVTQEAN